MLAEIPSLVLDAPDLPDPLTRIQIFEMALRWVLEEVDRAQVQYAITSGQSGHPGQSSPIDPDWTKENVRSVLINQIEHHHPPSTTSQ